jgi:hypothetical protein
VEDLFAKTDALGVAELVRTRKLGARELLDGTLRRPPKDRSRACRMSSSS